jgi:hypothetical protein
VPMRHLAAKHMLHLMSAYVVSIELATALLIAMSNGYQFRKYNANHVYTPLIPIAHNFD